MLQGQKHTIIDKREIARDTFSIRLIAPLVAAKAGAGQFVMIRFSPSAERIPLTIARVDRQEGSITLVFLRTGFTTAALAQLRVHDTVEDVLGPLGHPTDLKQYQKVLFVAGGVGMAELYPVLAYYSALPGKKAEVIIGAKSKEYLFWADKFQELCAELYICTDDGSAGAKGLVTAVAEDVLSTKKGFDLVYAVGPVRMMQKAVEISGQYSVRSMVSLNSIMVDGTGMCGSCRITYDKKTKFVCVDGPDFDGALVDFNELAQRTTFFKEKECALFHKHACPRKE